MERRLDRLSRAFGGGDDCGPLALIAPNSWSDADQAAGERAQIRHDEDAEGALIEKYAGYSVRPCRCATAVHRHCRPGARGDRERRRSDPRRLA
jgi:hypothetical protein